MSRISLSENVYSKKRLQQIPKQRLGEIPRSKLRGEESSAPPTFKVSSPDERMLINPASKPAVAKKLLHLNERVQIRRKKPRLAETGAEMHPRNRGNSSSSGSSSMSGPHSRLESPAKDLEGKKIPAFAKKKRSQSHCRKDPPKSGVASLASTLMALQQSSPSGTMGNSFSTNASTRQTPKPPIHEKGKGCFNVESNLNVLKLAEESLAYLDRELNRSFRKQNDRYSTMQVVSLKPSKKGTKLSSA